MGKVLSGEVKMKPRWYFLLGSTLSFIGMVGLIIGAVFLTNLTMFLLRKHGTGTGRLIQMYDSFPMWIPLLAVVSILIGIWVLKKYDFSYKQNFLTLAVALVIAIVVSAKIIDASGLNDIWAKRGPMKRFYSKDLPTRL